MDHSTRKTLLSLALLMWILLIAQPYPAVAQETGSLPVCDNTGFRNTDQYFFSPEFQRDGVVFAVATKPGDDNWKLYRSADGGVTWSLSRSERPFTVSFSQKYAEDATVFAMAYTGQPVEAVILRSVDRGVTWERMVFPQDGPTPGSVAPMVALDSRTILYAYGDGPDPYDPRTRGLFRIEFGEESATWEQLATGNTNAVAVSPRFAQDQTIFIGQFAYKVNLGLKKSTDGGTTWHASNAGLGLSPAANGYAKTDEVIFSPGYPADGLLFVRSSLLYYRSMDRGASWQRVDSLTVPVGNPSMHPARWVLSPNFTEDRTAWIDFGAWITRDAGDTWRPTHGTQVMDLAARAWCEGERCGTLLLGGGSGWDERAGVYKSLDLGWTWQCADAPAPDWWPNVPPVVATWLPVVFK